MNEIINQYSTLTAAKVKQHEDSISGLQDSLSRAEDFFKDIYQLPSEWREDMLSPHDQKAKFVAKVEGQVAAKTITADQGEQLKAAIDNAFSFNPTVLASKQEMVDSINYQIAVEIAAQKKTKGELTTTMQKVAFYGSETTRRIKGLDKVDALTKLSSAGGSISSAIGKFESGGAYNIVSGALDITSAVAQILPPPASIYTESFSAILGIFMPGAAGPSNQDVINEIKGAINEGFEEQKEFITLQFEEQRRYIEDQFTSFEGGLFEQDLEELQRQSNAVLKYLQEKQAYLFEIDEEQVLSEHELTRVTAELDLLDDTKDTSYIRQFFIDACRDDAIRENKLQNNSSKVEICLMILFDYLTIEKFRDMILVRFLALRNLELETSSVTMAYWAVQQQRKSDVEDFLEAIEQNEGYDLEYDQRTHQDFTGLKITCYLAGDGENVPNKLPQDYLSELQDYISGVKGPTFDGYSGACNRATELCKYLFIFDFFQT